MGMTLDIRFPAGSVPGWEAIRAKLTAAGESPLLRMIDGLPAFPDEVPEPTWRELRVSLGGPMITLRRTDAGFACVAWGNLDEAGIQAWNRLAWACAAAGEGTVQSLSADAFAASVNLRAS